MSRFAVGSTIPGLNTSGFSQTAGIQQAGRQFTNQNILQGLQQLQQLIDSQQSQILNRERLELDRRNAISAERLKSLEQLLQGGSLGESIQAREAGNDLSQQDINLRRELGRKELNLTERLGLGQLSQQEQELVLRRLLGLGELEQGERQLNIQEALGLGQLSQQEQELVLRRLLGLGELKQGERQLDIQEEQGNRRLDQGERQLDIQEEQGNRGLDIQEKRLDLDTFTARGELDLRRRAQDLAEQLGLKEASQNDIRILRDFLELISRDQQVNRQLDQADRQLSQDEKKNILDNLTRLQSNIPQKPQGVSENALLNAQDFINKKITTDQFVLGALTADTEADRRFFSDAAFNQIIQEVKTASEGGGFFSSLFGQNRQGIGPKEREQIVERIRKLSSVLTPEAQERISPLLSIPLSGRLPPLGFGGLLPRQLFQLNPKQVREFLNSNPSLNTVRNIQSGPDSALELQRLLLEQLSQLNQR